MIVGYSMGFPEDVMRGFVRKEIRIRFPIHEGWDLQQVKSADNKGFVFQVSRYHQGKKQYAQISASFNRRPTPGEIPVARGDPMDRRVSVGSFLLAPEGADTSGITAPVGVLTMNSFGFIENDLVWLTKKKNAQVFPLMEAIDR